jgi:hypothetical protein
MAIEALFSSALAVERLVVSTLRFDALCMASKLEIQIFKALVIERIAGVMPS